MIFPIKVREGGSEGMSKTAIKVGVGWSMQWRAFVWVMSSFISWFTRSMEAKARKWKENGKTSRRVDLMGIKRGGKVRDEQRFQKTLQESGYCCGSLFVSGCF